ncbi:MAG: bifunctional hydroxymethylpyrimidine kinase/phosphomethylpyrimidine kinase [Acidobacteriaceae bacterium]
MALTVAGFDPSSGAGATADLKVFANHGVYGVAAMTALTVQSTLGVRRVEPVSAQLLQETLDCLAEDLTIAGVKIGMLGSAEAVRVVAAFLRGARIPRERVVLDPVIRASSGAELLSAEGLGILRDKLLPVVGWVTPNVDELGALLGEPGEFVSRDHIPELAERLAGLVRPDSEKRGLNVVVTGGHLYPPDDFLRTSDGDETWFPGERVETTSTHGTGCAFSSALLCRVLAGDSPVDAVGMAKRFVRNALETAAPLGHGRGPVI